MNFKGLGKVFKFTLSQQLKGKAFKVSTVIILSIIIIGVALINLIPALMSMGDKTPAQEPGNVNTVNPEISISTLYYLDETDLQIDVAPAMAQSFPKLAVKAASSESDIMEQLKTTSSPEVLVTLTKDEQGYSLVLYKPLNEDLIASGDSDILLSTLSSTIYTTRLINAGVAPDDITTITANINTQTVKSGEEPKSMIQEILEAVVPMAISMMLFYIIYFYGYWVATSIVNEKSSRVMELLLTSVKPLAVVAGKCLSMGLLALTQFVAIIAAAALSYTGSAQLAISMTNGKYQPFDISTVFTYFNASSVIIVVIMFILGYSLYAMFNALAGSTVSRAEDLNMSLQPTIFLTMIGFFLSYFAPTVGNPTLTAVAALCPLSSPFYLPGAIIMGKVSLPMMLGSIAILVVTIVVVLLFTAKLYSTIILHTGNRLKFKDLFAIYKNK